MDSKIAGCLVQRNFYDHVIEEAVAIYLHRTADPEEPIRDGPSKKEVFWVNLQCAVFLFVARGVSKADACGSNIYLVNNKSLCFPCFQTKRCPCFQTKTWFNCINENLGARKKLIFSFSRSIHLPTFSFSNINSSNDFYILCKRGGGSHDFSFKFFGFTVPKISLGNTSVFQKISGIQKFHASERGGGITFSVKNFMSHSTKKFRWGTLRCFRKFRISQIFMHKKGISLNSVEKFLSHGADKIRRRTLLCFEWILVSKVFKHRRGKFHDFVESFLISQDRKNFAGEPFCVSEKFW